MMPELCVKYFSKKYILVSNNDVNRICAVNVEQYCICRGIDDGSRMICDNDYCGTQWFHVKCLKMKHVRKGAWYCGKCVKDKCDMYGYVCGKTLVSRTTHFSSEPRFHQCRVPLNNSTPKIHFNRVIDVLHICTHFSMM